MTPSDPHIRSAITQNAADWYAAHRGGPLSPPDRAAFLSWLKASPLHIEEYLGVAALEHSLSAAADDPALSVDALVQMARSDQSDNVVDLAGAPVRAEPMHMKPAWRFWPAVAAACLSAVILGGLWVKREQGVGVAKTYSTGHGEQGSWPLADGSTLRLNTDTVVTVRFSPAERLVEVDHGQIAVEVAHADHRLFRVHAGSANAVAVGTEFGVYRRPKSTLVSVLTGQVAVSVDEFQAPQTTPTRLHGLQVGAGEQVDIVAGVLPPAAEPGDTRETMAWLERKIVFDQRPLGAVADEFNRYNAIPFTIDDPALRRLPISGAFNAADTDSFAAFLESLDGVRVERLATRFKVLGSRGRGVT